MKMATTSNEKWTRNDLIAYCIMWSLEVEGEVHYDYLESLNKKTYEELHREADFLWGLQGK